MFISSSRSFIFVHIQKSGGTSITHALEETMRWNDLVIGSTELGRLLQPIYREKFKLNKHSTAAEIRTVVGDGLWSNCFTFAFVRHPFARTASLYTYVKKLAAGHLKRKHSLRRRIASRIYYFPEKNTEFFDWPSTKAFLSTVSFSEFIRHPSLSEDQAIRAQANWTNDEDGKQIVDFVGKFENLNNDFDTVCERLGITARLPHRNQSSERLTDWTRLFKDESDYQIVKEYFAKDFEQFGYNPDWRGEPMQNCLSQ